MYQHYPLYNKYLYINVLDACLLKFDGFLSVIIKQLLASVELELLTLQEHQHSPLIFSNVHVTQSSFLCCIWSNHVYQFALSLWPLYCQCLCFFQLQLLITILASSALFYSVTMCVCI